MAMEAAPVSFSGTGSGLASMTSSGYQTEMREEKTKTHQEKTNGQTFDSGLGSSSNTGAGFGISTYSTN